MADSTVAALVFENEKAAERLFDTLQETLKAESFQLIMLLWLFTSRVAKLLSRHGPIQ